MLKRRQTFLILFLIYTAFAWGQWLQTDGKTIIDQNGNEVILRGMGLGGWMLMEGYMMQSSDVADTQHEFKEKLMELMGEEKTDEFYESWLANHVTENDVDSLASWGFNSIRLPMHYNLFTLPIELEPVPGENTWLTKGFELVDSLLQWCKSNSIYLILDLHAAPGGQGKNAAISDYDPSKPSLWESKANRDKTVALWKKLAERYQDEGWIGGYDLINEVNWTLPGNSLLRSLYMEITDSIRAIGDMHIIFIEGNGFANDFTGLTPPWDENMAYSFHKYWNYNDQGSIQWVLDIRENHNVPLWMGEGGENSNVWFCDAIRLFEDNNIGWSWWPMKRIETIVGPYSIEYSEGYRNVLRYWRGEGPKPTVDEAYEGMMELAENTNSANCLYRKDVHDAMIRQPGTDETIPYSEHTIPGVVFMSDFDLGRINFAYYDIDHVNHSASTGFFQAWNSGWHYRNDGVDIEPNDDVINSNGYHVGYVRKGEWTNYTVQIEDSAMYTALARVASPSSGGRFHLSLNNEAVTTTQTVSATGGWTNFMDLEIPGMLLDKGEHVLTFWIDGAGEFNISSIEFLKTGIADTVPMKAINGQVGLDERSIEVEINLPIQPESLNGSIENFTLTINGTEEPVNSISMDGTRRRTIVLSIDDDIAYTDEIRVSYNGNVIESPTGKILQVFTDLEIRNTAPERFILPRIIQAEDFYSMIGFGLEECSDLGGGYNLGFADPGDYADYLIFSPGEMNYQLGLRVASLHAQSKLGFYLVQNDTVETELCTVTVPFTGGWQDWTTINATVSIPKGKNTLKMRAISGEFNLNWFKFEAMNPVESLDVESKHRIYPNPVSGDKLYMHLERKNIDSLIIDCFSVTGKLISSRKYPAANGDVEMDISHIPVGVYTMKVYTGTEIVTYKIIRQ
jgi:hypothetical protein